MGGSQLRGRDHPEPAPGAGRRAVLDPHRGARGRRPRHQARPGGDHPRHPERRSRSCSPTSTSAASSGSAPRFAPATSSSARSRPRARPSCPRRSACCAPSSTRRAARFATPRSRFPTVRPARSSASRCSTRRMATTSSAPASTSACRVHRPEAQDHRGRQARRPPRQQGRHLQDPARRGHAVPWRTGPRSTSSSTRSVSPVG